MTTLTRRSLLAMAPAAFAQPRQEPLFNGKNLDGWYRAAFGIWRIENGELTGTSDHTLPGPGYLMTQRAFRDFDLRLEFWISRGGNSGVYIREPHRAWGSKGDLRPAHGKSRGYEIQIDYNDRKNLTGSVYDLKKPDRVLGGEERWNRYRIVCRAKRVEIWLNGEQANAFDGIESAEGAIGFQIHGQQPHDHRVKFRNIEIISL
ncbi:MAG: DUF1080 domain-containing protein [Bryobacterales bacterium]|nr:DUF1080 domain-containing protein [Bryobacterales bacterium]